MQRNGGRARVLVRRTCTRVRAQDVQSIYIRARVLVDDFNFIVRTRTMEDAGVTEREEGRWRPEQRVSEAKWRYTAEKQGLTQ